MSKVIDLTEYLDNEKSKIKIGVDTYEVNDSYNAILALSELSEKNKMDTPKQQSDFMSKFFKIALGEENSKKLLSKNYNVKMYKQIIVEISKIIQGEDDEENTPS